MNKKLFIGLVVLMSLALLGIIGMQYFWFRNSIRVKQAELNLSVNEAMRNSALKLESRETLQKLLASLNKSDTPTVMVPSLLGSRNAKPFPTVNEKSPINAVEKKQEVLQKAISDLNEKNLPSISSDDKFPAFTGGNYKYSIDIDSVVFAEEMHAQMFRYAQYLRHEHDKEVRRGDDQDTKDENRPRENEKSGEVNNVVKTPAEPRSKIVIDGKVIRVPSFKDVVTLRKVIGEYYRSVPNEKSRTAGSTMSAEAFKNELKRNQVRLPDSILKFKIDSFIKRKYNNPIDHPSHSDIAEFEKRFAPQGRNPGFGSNNFGFPFFGPGQPQTGKPLTHKDSVVQNRVQHLTGIIDQIILEVSTDHSLFNKRLNTKLIDSVLVNELKYNGVNLKPEYAVYNDQTGKQSSIFSAGYIAAEAPDYSTRLFPDDLFGSPYSLKVQFKNRDIYVLQSMSLMLSMSILLTSFLILAFIIALWAIVKQKKISEIRSDFINNITHEFKTPISTIGLAIDAIDNPKIIGNQEQIHNFTRIIREENYRMNQLVENVLRAALLDRHNMNEHIDDVDLHALILKAVSHSQLQIESRSGILHLHLDAEKSIVGADATQLLNALLNLIDNAIKYSKEAPEITISTHQSGNKIVCSIEDKGIGIRNDVQRRIFDRFYRYTEGNIHDVKGHGLGLSFVKAIVDAHNGRISVESELGKGSRFEVIIPLKPEINE